MNNIVLGNVIAFFGSGLMVLSGFVTKKKAFLMVQNVMFAILATANLVLGGVTGCIVNLVSIVRNVLSVRVRFTWAWKAVFIALQVALSVSTNTQGLLGWLPIMSGIIFTAFLDVQDEKKLKLVVLAAQSMWVIYDFALMNYTGFAFDIFALLSNSIALYRLSRKTA